MKISNETGLNSFMGNRNSRLRHRMINLRSVLCVVFMFTFHGSLTSYARDSGDLIWAAYQGDLSKVKTLLGQGADVNKADKNGYTPLFSASLIGHVELIKLLLVAGADVNKAPQMVQRGI